MQCILFLTSILASMICRIATVDGIVPEVARKEERTFNISLSCPPLTASGILNILWWWGILPSAAL